MKCRRLGCDLCFRVKRGAHLGGVLAHHKRCGCGTRGRSKARVVTSPKHRIAGAPAPLYGTGTSGVFLGARAEAEMAYGDQFKILLSSQHLADARVSLTYRLARGVRAHVGYTAPSSLVTLMLDVGDKVQGFYLPSDVRPL